jgi:DNA helicase HerA-like ATPase
MKLLKKPTNRQAYAKVGIYGDAGSGKTTTAAKIGIGLAHLRGKRIAFFDTEGGSDYLIKTFENNGIELFVSDISRDFKYLLAFVNEAVDEKIDVIIVDSITHIWKQLQKDYLSELNERNVENGRKKRFALEFQDWRFIKDRWQEFTDLYLTSPIHTIIAVVWLKCMIIRKMKPQAKKS